MVLLNLWKNVSSDSFVCVHVFSCAPVICLKCPPLINCTTQVCKHGAEQKRKIKGSQDAPLSTYTSFEFHVVLALQVVWAAICFTVKWFESAPRMLQIRQEWGSHKRQGDGILTLDPLVNFHISPQSV